MKIKKAGAKCSGFLFEIQKLLLRSGDGLGDQREREAGFLPVRGRALDDAGLHSLVVGGVDAGEQLGGFVFFTGSHDGAEFFFHAAEVGGDAAVVRLLAGGAAHAAFG